jgi:hypothetical protein
MVEVRAALNYPVAQSALDRHTCDAFTRRSPAWDYEPPRLCGMARTTETTVMPDHMMTRQPSPAQPDRPARFLRPALAVVAAVLLFGLTVRPLGLAVALPFSVFTSGLAASPVRWLQLVALTVTLSAAIAAVTKLMLRLPVPLWPQPLASIFGG